MYDPNNFAGGKNYRKALKMRAERAKIFLRSRPLERGTTSRLENRTSNMFIIDLRLEKEFMFS